MFEKLFHIGLAGLLYCTIASAFTGCVNDAPVPPPKELKLGDSIISNTIVVPVGGGIFYFNTADTSKSARIIFPPNSYSSSKTITLTVTPIKGSSFGDNITPASSLFTIDAGSDFSSQDIILNIPFVVDTNNFSMAFFYDRVSFELEGVPTIGYYGKSRPSVFSVATRRSGSIFISTIPKIRLGLNASSSFDPKQDNWEFPNYGTAITPNGQFAGQALSAAWYYYEKALKGSPHLYGTFDSDHGGESPKLWQDNDLGFRVASETQQGLKWNTTAYSMMAPLNNGNITLTLDEVLYSMMVTGKPQIISVIKDSIVLPLIVYKVVNDQFYVSDPNYPTGGNQSIFAILNLMSDYYAGTSMHDLKVNRSAKYINPTYIGVRAMIDWDAITKIWTDAQNNVYPSFPPSTITFKDASGPLVPSATGLVTLFNNVTLSVTGNQPSLIQIYQNGTVTLYDPANGISLKPGSNPFSIYFQNLSSGGSDTLWSGFRSANIQEQAFTIIASTDSVFIENDFVLHTFMGQKPSGPLRYEWDMGDGTLITKNTDSIKYRYHKTGTFTVSLSIFSVNSNTLLGKETVPLTVSLNHVVISPILTTGTVNLPHIFYGLINLPKDIVQRCEWNMGDGSAKKTIIGADTIQYTFQKTGSVTVQLNIFDNATNVLLGSAQEIINLSLNPVFISPTPFTGIANIPYVFYGLISVPNNIVQRCEWNMGDGSGIKSIVGFDTIQHTFQKTGSFTVQLNIFDNTTNLLLGSAQGTVNIDQVQLPTLAQLKAMKFITVSFFANNHYQSNVFYLFTGDTSNTISINGGSPEDTDSRRLIWADLTARSSFYISHYQKDSLHYSTFYDFDNQMISCSFSSDFSLIEIVSADHSSGSESTNDGPGSTERSESLSAEQKLSFSKIPLIRFNQDTINYQFSGSQVKFFASTIIDYRHDDVDERLGLDPHIVIDYVFTNWIDFVNLPRITVTLTK